MQSISKEELYNYYINQNLNQLDIASIYNISRRSIGNLLKKYNITKNVQEIRNKRKETCLQKYGYLTNLQSQDYRAVRKKTLLKKYGNEKYYNEKKRKETCLQKYGVDNVAKNNIVKEKIALTKQSLDYKNISQKRLETINQRYGSMSKCLQQIPLDVIKKLEDKEIFTTIVNKFKNVQLIADYLNVTHSTIGLWINKHNLMSLIDNYRSKYELDIYNHFKVFNPISNSKIISPYEIDIYIPEKKIGIEFNGNYWHSELYKSMNYHKEKSFLSEEKGIFLYHIFEHEWITKQDKIINQLNNLLGLNKQKIYARKCIVKEVDNKEKKSFLNLNHLQGNDNSSVKLGLYYQNELVSLMTFCKPRFNKKYEWELSRFCCKANCSIIGGASKLFKYFVSTYNPTSILSYSDIAKTRGNMYSVLGFNMISISQPNFVWIKGNEVLSRYQCQKHKLLALGYTGSTGIEIMHERGYNRLYDAGNKVWVWKN